MNVHVLSSSLPLRKMITLAAGLLGSSEREKYLPFSMAKSGSTVSTTASSCVPARVKRCFGRTRYSRAGLDAGGPDAHEHLAAFGRGLAIA